MGIQRPIGLSIFSDRNQQVQIFGCPDGRDFSQPCLKRVREIPQGLAADQACTLMGATCAYNSCQRTNESFIDHGVWP